MRRLITGLAVALVLHAWSGSAHAQLFGLSVPFSNQNSQAISTNVPRMLGGNTQRLQFKMVDTSSAVSAPGYASQIASGSSRFSFSNILRPWNFLSYDADRGPASSNLPSPASFQSTRYPNSFQPVRPIIPGQ